MVIDLKARLLAEVRERIEEGDYDGAVPLLEKLTRFARGDRESLKFAQVNLAALLFEHGDPRSVEHFRRALEIDPADDRVRYCLGHAHLDAEQVEEAVTEFSRALDGRPGDAEYLRSLGAALAGAGRLDEALATLQTAVKARPLDPFMLKDLAQIEAALGHHERALKHMRSAVRLAPDEPIFTEVLEELLHLSEVEKLARPRR